MYESGPTIGSGYSAKNNHRDRRAPKLAMKPEPRASATPGKTRSTPLSLAFHVNKIPISAAIEGRGAQDMVALVLRRRVGPIRASNLILGKKGGGHVEQHEEQHNREG